MSADGRVVPGKRYYLITHAYHHFVCELVELLGPQRGLIKNVCWVYTCRRDWTSFFAEGFKDDTVYKKFPPGEVSWFAAFEWEHPIP